MKFAVGYGIYTSPFIVILEPFLIILVTGNIINTNTHIIPIST